MVFLLFPIYGLLMGLRLAALRAAGAPLLGGRFYSLSLKDVAIAWLERAQLFFLIFHTFVCKFGRVKGGAGKKLQTKV